VLLEDPLVNFLDFNVLGGEEVSKTKKKGEREKKKRKKKERKKKLKNK